ncbi:MAG: FAD-dependent oxidoreductase [Opitutaceae bacterium]|nr:FAD-dependent oxidoreductase [Opitutaceae bacterium]
MKYSSLDFGRFDVVVCGGGSAGIAAACSAARAGASTLLLERYGFCGGVVTAAMIHTLDAIKSCRDYGSDVVGGFASELIEEVRRLGGLAIDDNPGEALTVHPEVYKVAIDRLLARYGVTTLYHAHVCGSIVEGNRVVGVEAALRDGRARIYAGVVIDCTGDAEVVFYSDAGWTLDPELQPLTYHFRLGNLLGKLTWTEWETVMGRALNAAHADGEIGVFGGPWVIRLADGEISINSTRVYGNPVDPLGLSNVEQEGRAQMLQLWSVLRRRVPELAESYILAGASQLHIRESRKLQGEYVLTEEDIQSGAEFADSIALGAWPIDIHPTNGSVGVHPHKEDPPTPYEIPYRCLIPKRVDGLLVAGKAISTTHRAHGSTRVPGTSLATGQAAGIAAALAARAGILPRRIDIRELRATLQAQGAIVSYAEGMPRA